MTSSLNSAAADPALDSSSARAATLPFDFQPDLQGKLLQLRPLRKDDFAELYTVAADPLIWEQHPVPDRHEEEVFRDYFDRLLAFGGALAVVDAKNGSIIGATAFENMDEARSEIEIGWTFLARRCWGGAYNGEMKRLMLAHAFRSFDNVVFRVGPGNVRSQTAVRKIGGTHP